MYDNPYESNTNLNNTEPLNFNSEPTVQSAEQNAAAAQPEAEYSGQPEYDSQPENAYGEQAVFAAQPDVNGDYRQPSVEPPRIIPESEYAGETVYVETYEDTNTQQAEPQPQRQYTSAYDPDFYSRPRAPRQKKKKERKPVTRGALAAVLIISIVSSMLLGVGGGFLAFQFFGSSSSQTSSASASGLNVSKSDGNSATYAASGAALTTSEIVKKAADTVVEITTESVVTGSFNQQYIQSGAGSGVIITTDGYIVTNYHVIEDASQITVTLRDQTEYTDVKVVGTYEAGDIALLKISPKSELTAAVLGDSDKIAVGDYAVVIGNPLGQLGGSVTDGIISALDREVTIDNETMNLLQTNAEISPGNSGGGLFNGQGELIGIVNAKSSSDSAEGIGFAIPINDVQDILSDLKQYGYVKGQIDLGMSLTDVNSTARLWMFGSDQIGVYVTGVNSGSNAEKAGFKYGDIITAVNNEKVSSTKELNAIIKKLSVGDKVTFAVNRSGRTGKITMTLQEYTASPQTDNSKSSESSDFGSDFSDEIDDIWDIFN